MDFPDAFFPQIATRSFPPMDKLTFFRIILSAAYPILEPLIDSQLSELILFGISENLGKIISGNLKSDN